MECTKSELDLFTRKQIQTVIKNNREIPYKSVSTLDNDTQIEFSCLGDSQYYRDLASIRLWLKVQLVKLSGEEFKSTDVDQPGCVNDLLNSLFSGVTVSLNETTITKNSDNYPYRGLIETLLNYSNDAVKTHLTNRLFYLDTHDSNGALSATNENDGFKSRAANLKDSQVVELEGRIHGDIFNVPQLLIPNVDIKVKLNRAPPQFYIFSKSNDVTGKIKILDATLKIKRVEVSSDYAFQVERHLLKEPTTFHLNRVEVTSLTVSKGSNAINLPHVIHGTIPKYIIFGLVKNAGYVGSFDTNPFQFIHSSLNYIAVFVNGEMVSDPIKCDFKHIGSIATAYQTLFTGTGIHHHNQGHLITKDMFYHGYTFFAFDLSPDSAGIETHSSLPQEGTVRIEFRFANPLADSLSCIVYAVYDGTITIDHNRSVSLLD